MAEPEQDPTRQDAIERLATAADEAKGHLRQLAERKPTDRLAIGSFAVALIAIGISVAQCRSSDSGVAAAQKAAETARDQLIESERADETSKRFEYVRAIFDPKTCDDSERRCSFDDSRCRQSLGECEPASHLAVRQAAAQALVSASHPLIGVDGGEAWHVLVLQHARLTWVDFRGAQLAKVNFYGTDLRCAMFDAKTTFGGTTFERTDLRGADFPSDAAKHALADATWGAFVICPDGYLAAKPNEKCTDHMIGAPRREDATCDWHRNALCLPVVVNGKSVLAEEALDNGNGGKPREDQCKPPSSTKKDQRDAGR